MNKTRYRHTPSEQWHKFREKHAKNKKKEVAVKYTDLGLRLFDLRFYEVYKEAL